MRTLGILGICALAALGAMSAMAGCYSLSADCKFNLTDCENIAAGGSSGAGGSGSGGNSSGVGGAPPDCVPASNSTPIDNSCGVFVSLSLGDDTFAGTKEQPFGTITQALAKANGKPIYLCGEPLLESVKVTANAAFYGGLDCSKDWGYNATLRTLVDAPENEVALNVATKVSLETFDVDFRAEDAALASKSSIAIIAEADAELSLTRSYVLAGNGTGGDDGEAYSDVAADGTAGIDGGAACSASTVVTPDPPTTTCGSIDSVAGGGGPGQTSIGLPGGPGEPQGAMNGGQGESAAAKCTDGGAGDAGMPGTSGPGALEIGLLQAGLGYIGSPGNEGKPGAPGQGGGGGGGSKGGNPCAGLQGKGGASGGTGGTGGCGGLGGRGGQAGGSSIGIISLNAKLSLADVKIETQTGGTGGNGGDGQPGGGGGKGGTGGMAPQIGLHVGCNGGVGGVGGQGGKGGGGHGGHSIGIAYKGTEPDTKGATIMNGPAGNGGAGDGDPGTGAPGVAAPTQVFN